MEEKNVDAQSNNEMNELLETNITPYKNIEDAPNENEDVDTLENALMTDEELKKLYINQLKASKIRFVNTIHDGSITRTKFNTEYKKTRQKKNKSQRKSRKANR